MIVFELILELVGRFVVEILFEVIILGFWKLIKKAWRFIKYEVFGLEKTKQAPQRMKVQKETALQKDATYLEP